VPFKISALLNSPIKFGNTLHQTWKDRIGDADAALQKESPVTMSDVFDQWWDEYVMAQLKPSTRESYHLPLRRVRLAFGHLEPGAIGPAHAERYRTWRAEKSKATAKKEISVLSSAMTFAAEQGLIEYNPLRGHSSRADFERDCAGNRTPGTDEVQAFCDLNPHLKGYVDLKLITGLKQRRLLAIDLSSDWDGATLKLPARRGDDEYSQSGKALASAIAAILEERLPVGPLFLNTQGRRVKASSFRSSWRRAMLKYQQSGSRKFSEQDIQRSGSATATGTKPTRKAPKIAIEPTVESAIDPVEPANAEQPEPLTAAQSIAARVRNFNFAQSMMMPPAPEEPRNQVHSPGV